MENSKGPSRRRHFTTRRPAGESRAERVHFTDRDFDYSTDRKFSSSENSPRKEYSERGPRKEFSQRGPRNDGQSHGFSSDRGPKREYSDRGPKREYSDRGPKRDFSDREPKKDFQGRGSRKESAGKGPRRDPSSRKPYQGTRHAQEDGIQNMLSRKAAFDSSISMSDNDHVAPPMKEVVRLNKFIANSGVCSRREADTFILAGVVTVNGEIVTELGTKVNVMTDDIRFNGERLKGEEKVYIVMNKPKGYVTTAGDPHADKTVMDLIKGLNVRVFPVGRLDKNTTGVLMFTNDGEIAETLTHPSFNKKKIYQVILDKALTQEDHDKVMEGISLSDGVVKADELEYVDAEDHRKLGIEIHSGKNRIVRRIFESMGYDVKALDRVYFAGLTKKGLKKGQWRFLTEGEVNILKMGAFV